MALSEPKLFVLDTNVLLHDPLCFFRFKEHDIFLPMATLEEMDAHKKGHTDAARHARQASRCLDELLNFAASLTEGVPLNALGHANAQGRLFFQNALTEARLPESLPGDKPDNQILAVLMALSGHHPGHEAVVLVSKDINVRIKARLLGLNAEEYTSEQALNDSDVLYRGYRRADSASWLNANPIAQKNGQASYCVDNAKGFIANEFLLDDSIEPPVAARVLSVSGSLAQLNALEDYTRAHRAVWGVTARNWGQNFALNLLMDPNIDLVALLGQAGTGKTLLTLAAALSQTLDDKRFNEIIMTRATVPVGEDIGFLPGTEEEKMHPWMGALEDNLEVLTQTESGMLDFARTMTQDLIASKIQIKSLNFMRGRTFRRKFLIIDEAQNLTPKQMKMLITRAGDGAKVVCLGNLAQIDSPYLTEGGSGLTYLVERFKGWAHFGAVTLQQGERSRLADYAIDVL